MSGFGEVNFHPVRQLNSCCVKKLILCAENKNIAGEFKVEGHREKKSSEFLEAARI